MGWLAENRPVVSMETIAEAYRENKDLPEGAVAVTFDDGFLNNYSEAWPVLEEHGLPATIYLATGFIGTGRMIWSDVLEANILGSKVDRISLGFPDGPLDWPLGGNNDKIAAFLKIKEICKRLPNDAKDEIVAQVTSLSGAKVATDHPLYAFMSWDEVRTMNASPLIEFGAHTVDHVSLAKVSGEVMASQIDESVAALEQNLGHACHYFSYPEGQEGDYGDGVIDYLKFRQFDHSPTAIDGVNTLDTVGPFDMKRMMVGFEGRAFPFADI
jgi:peptidoglycan/xylan/chitin deacetylase (PgdA/CDA1 family)